MTGPSCAGSGGRSRRGRADGWGRGNKGSSITVGVWVTEGRGGEDNVVEKGDAVTVQEQKADDDSKGTGR